MVKKQSVKTQALQNASFLSREPFLPTADSQYCRDSEFPPTGMAVGSQPSAVSKSRESEFPPTRGTLWLIPVYSATAVMIADQFPSDQNGHPVVGMRL